MDLDPDLAGRLRRGEIDILAHLDQLQAAFDAVEADVRAFLPEPGRFERLRRQAQELLVRYPEPAERPPLFGLPVGVKDIFHVEGFATAAGAGEPSEAIQGPEADAVTRLKRAGALILGKTVTTEFAYFAPGPTRNPHNLEHTPGGSSSGSAAAVAAGLSPLTLGTQTIGSVVRPAAFCGVVGFKPSYGRISRAGLIPLADSVDHVGTFTPDVATAATVAPLLCYDWEAQEVDRKPVLAVPEGPYLEHVEPEGRQHFERALDQLRAAGYELQRADVLADFDDIRGAHDTIVAAEAARAHAAWFDTYADRYHPTTRELIERGRAIDEHELLRARDSRLRLRARLERSMDRNGIDLWLAPAAPGPAPHGLESTGNPVMNLPWTHSGLPVIGLPAGSNGSGLPLALQFVGRWYADEVLLAWAPGLETILAQFADSENGANA